MLRLGGERLERVMKLNDLIGEPGETYYGVMCQNRRYMRFDPLPSPSDDPEDPIEVDQPHGVDEADGRHSRLSHLSDLSAEVRRQIAFFDEAEDYGRVMNARYQRP